MFRTLQKYLIKHGIFDEQNYRLALKEGYLNKLQISKSMNNKYHILQPRSNDKFCNKFF